MTTNTDGKSGTKSGHSHHSGGSSRTPTKSHHSGSVICCSFCSKSSRERTIKSYKCGHRCCHGEKSCCHFFDDCFKRSKEDEQRVNKDLCPLCRIYDFWYKKNKKPDNSCPPPSCKPQPSCPPSYNQDRYNRWYQYRVRWYYQYYYYYWYYWQVNWQGCPPASCGEKPQRCPPSSWGGSSRSGSRKTPRSRGGSAKSHHSSHPSRKSPASGPHSSRPQGSSKKSPSSKH